MAATITNRARGWPTSRGAIHSAQATMARQHQREGDAQPSGIGEAEEAVDREVRHDAAPTGDAAAAGDRDADRAFFLHAAGQQEA